MDTFFLIDPLIYKSKIIDWAEEVFLNDEHELLYVNKVILKIYR